MEEIGNILIEYIITGNGVPACKIYRQKNTFMALLLNHMFDKYNIKNKDSSSL